MLHFCSPNIMRRVRERKKDNEKGKHHRPTATVTRKKSASLASNWFHFTTFFIFHSSINDTQKIETPFTKSSQINLPIYRRFSSSFFSVLERLCHKMRNYFPAASDRIYSEKCDSLFKVGNHNSVIVVFYFIFHSLTDILYMYL